MTLVVAANHGDYVWILADTAISDPLLTLRERKFEPKVFRVRTSSTIAYAGIVASAKKIIAEAAHLPEGKETLEFLHASQVADPTVEFAYAFFDKGNPKLFKIANGKAEEVQNLYLGSHTAFEAYQKYRLGPIDHAPNSGHLLLLGAPQGLKAERDLHSGILAMFQIFGARTDRDVGGWVTAHMLSSDEASLIPYAYSVTDPLLRTLQSGDHIPFGTAEQGGLTLSVTQVGQEDGWVVYWLQPRLGHVFLRRENEAEFDRYSFQGAPAEFIAAATNKLEREIRLLVDDTPDHGTQIIDVTLDAQGRERIAWIQGQKGIFPVWINTSDQSWSAAGTFGPKLGAPRTREERMGFTLEVTLDEERRTVSLQFPPEVNITGDNLDEFILALGEVRSQMRPHFPSEPRFEDSTRYAHNPRWNASLSTTGSTIRLQVRHPLFGWLTFELPKKEAMNLGAFLSTAATSAAQ